MNRPRTYRQRTRQHGQAVVELCLSVIMFAILLSLVATMCVFLYMQTNVITAAREGARMAASDPNFKLGNTTTYQSDVKNRVINFFSQTTGHTLTTSDITVNNPTGTVGYRNTSVTVNFTVNNPIPIADYLEALGVPSSTASHIGSLAITSTASSRYEE